MATEMAERAKRHLLAPWPSLATVGDDLRMPLSAADALTVYDAEGRALIDGPAGMWCVNLGHRRPELAQALFDQAMALPYCSPWYTTSDPAAELAAALAERAPGDLSRVFFTTGGSTAVETALRFVQYYFNALGKPEKKLIVTRDKAYHGSTYLSGSASGKRPAARLMDAADELMIRLSAPKALDRPAGESLEAFTDRLVAEFAAVIEERGADRIAAFIAEPIQASGGVVVPPEGYLPRLAELCRANDILFIADEVVTAFGRLGEVFASERVFGVTPDLLTFAKGVTSGYFPLGGVLISERLFARAKAATDADLSAPFAHGFTYSGHPIGCAVALVNLRLLEDSVLERVRELAPRFQAALKALEDLPLVAEVRGAGLMTAVECRLPGAAPDPVAEEKIGKLVDRHCQELGLLVRPIGAICVLSPPLVLAEADIERIAAILRQAISAAGDELLAG